MVVDLAVVGLPVGGGVGDDDVADGQAGPARVGREQRGAGVPRLGVVEPQQSLGTALDAGTVAASTAYGPTGAPGTSTR